MAKSLAFCNRKGGSGKTTTAVHVAAGLSLLNKEVLLIDCDPQAHASLWLLANEDPRSTLYEVLNDQCPVADAIYRTSKKGLYILPANKNLSQYEVNNTKIAGAAFFLRKRLEKIGNQFDYLVFDTPPYIGLLLVSVLTACEYVFVPVPLQFLALDGLFELNKLIDKIKSSANRLLQLNGIIPVMFNWQLKSTGKFLKELHKTFGKDLIFPYIRQNVRLSEAPGENKLVYDYAPKSNGALDYITLTKAIARSVQK